MLTWLHWPRPVHKGMKSFTRCMHNTNPLSILPSYIWRIHFHQWQVGPFLWVLQTCFNQLLENQEKQSMLNNAHPQVFAINFITPGWGHIGTRYFVTKRRNLLMSMDLAVCNGALIFPADSVQPSSLSNPTLSWTLTFSKPLTRRERTILSCPSPPLVMLLFCYNSLYRSIMDALMTLKRLNLDKSILFYIPECMMWWPFTISTCHPLPTYRWLI